MLSENVRKYLQYEVPAEAIFNHDLWEFAYAVRLEDYRECDGEAILSLSLSDGTTAELHVASWSPGVIRFRFGPQSAKFPGTSEMLVGSPEPCKLSIEQAQQSLRLRGGDLTVLFHFDPWSLKVCDPQGHCLQRSHDSGPKKTFFPLYPLGIQRSRSTAVVRTFASFDLAPDEAVYGLGEKFGPLNKRGLKLSSWNSDATNCSTDRAYKNVPFLMTTHGYGLFLHESRRIEYEIGNWSFTAYAFAVENDRLEWFFIYGPTLRTILERYTALTGRASIPPLWSFGLWMSRYGYRDRRELERVASELRRRQVPCDVLHLDPFWMREGHYCDLEWDENAFPEPEEMLASLAKRGFKVCLWEQPYVPTGTTMYEEGAKYGYFARDENGHTLLIRDFQQRPTAIVDFTSPEAKAWYQQKHRKLLRMGVAVFKTDMGEAVPREAVFSDGRTGRELHNLYPLLYNRTVWETVAEKWDGRGLVWGRSGYAGSQRFPVQWGGDSFSTFEEMAAVLRGGLSYALSGVPFWSQDIGGFQGDRPTPELYVRWAQWGLFNSHSRCHGVQPREPWEFGEEAERIFRKYVELRYRLLPYIWAAAHEAVRNGLPVMRPMVLEFQDDPTTWNLETQYLFGPYLLIVPVLDETGRVRYYLPEGEWLDFWHNQLLHGPRWIERIVPLEEMPILIRSGALVPMAPLAQYVGEHPWEPITLNVFLPQGTSRWTLYDETSHKILVAAQRDGDRASLEWSGTEVSVRVTWRAVPNPNQVLWSGSPLPTGAGPGKWQYSDGERILQVSLPSGRRDWRLEVLL